MEINIWTLIYSIIGSLLSIIMIMVGWTLNSTLKGINDSMISIRDDLKTTNRTLVEHIQDYSIHRTK